MSRPSCSNTFVADGIISFDEIQMTAYPNPTQDVLNVGIATMAETEGRLLLYNSLGQMVKEQKVSFLTKDRYTLDFPHGALQRKSRLTSECCMSQHLHKYLQSFSLKTEQLMKLLEI